MIREFGKLNLAIIAIDYFLAYGERFDNFLIFASAA